MMVGFLHPWLQHAATVASVPKESVLALDRSSGLVSGFHPPVLGAVSPQDWDYRPGPGLGV